MDWIHCNSCFNQPKENNTIKQQYHLTSCGHIFCENCGCFANDTSDCCKYCMNKCSSTLIGEKSFRTNPQVLEYFQEPEEVCEKLLKVMRFQKAHRIKLIGHHQRTLSKYNRAKMYIKKLENELKIAKNALRNNLQKSPYRITDSQSISTPIFHPNSTPFKMIDAEAKNIETPKIQKIKDFNYRKQSLRNELSMLSSGNTSVALTLDSSVYASPLKDNSDEKYMPKVNKLYLNSTGKKLQETNKMQRKCKENVYNQKLNSVIKNGSN